MPINIKPLGILFNNIQVEGNNLLIKETDNLSKMVKEEKLKKKKAKMENFEKCEKRRNRRRKSENFI